MNENISNANGDIDRWLEWIKDCKYLPETDFKQLCTIISDIFFEESNVQPVFSPVTICGDLHGQYYDVQELFRTGGYPPDTQYIFMGDFVDRGYYSLETLTQLLVFKAKWPDRITLLRGNHESRQVTQVYGFYDECMKKYGNANLWRYCCRLFDLMPIGALIDNEVLCIHGEFLLLLYVLKKKVRFIYLGGLSPDIGTIDQMRTIERDQEIPHRGGFCDLMWSDPDDIDWWAISPRGAGWLFGEKPTTQFMHNNQLSLICRAHQLVQEG